MKFYDPYGKTRLSSRKTLLFCAYHKFTIPHDIVGAILYSDALEGAADVEFSKEVMEEFIPSLHSFVADIDWYLAAIKSMGYQDIVDEFNALSADVANFIGERFATEPYDPAVVKEKVKAIVPDAYKKYLQKELKK